ncbi:MAG: diphthamide biosynthesis enzyme Dph2 [Candidatus Hodarchaeaceae archaeon]|nr:diphthamide biosynthesis enzyme Dph2 [Candidatus Hodarchaeaceae archaeon]
MYDFEPKRVKQFFRRHDVGRVAIQLPAGLRRYLPEIIPTYKESGVETLVLADSCYGGCDVADVVARQLGCDALVHYGHADMGLPTCLPTLYVEARMTVNPLEAVEGALPKLRFKRVGLATTVQHIGHLKKVAEFLRSRGFRPYIGEPGQRAKYPGQILGCDSGCVRSIADRVDGFIYIGTGRFHPLGIALSTGKDIVIANPVAGYSEELHWNPDVFLSRRRAMISRAAACEKFAVVVSTKLGQLRFKLATIVADGFRGAGLVAHVLAVDEVVPEGLADFDVDAFVCAACPRIPIDEADRFDRPILTPFEAMVMLGKANFGPYKLDEVRQNDF